MRSHFLARAAASAALAAGLLTLGTARPAFRDRLTIGQVSSAVTLDPHRHDNLYTFMALSHFYDTLVTFGPGMEVRPALAVCWENPTPTLWRLHLRQGVVFHDGRPFGAPDVVTSHSPRGAYGTFNHFGYANPALDRAIEAAEETLDPAVRKERLTEALRMVREDLPVLPLSLRVDLYAVRSDLEWQPRLDRWVRAMDFRVVDRR